MSYKYQPQIEAFIMKLAKKFDNKGKSQTNEDVVESSIEEDSRISQSADTGAEAIDNADSENDLR